MSGLSYFWRHPRRTGFILFNLLALALFIAWGAFTADMRNEGLGGIPNLMLGYTGLTILVVLWIGSWLAWGWLVATRQARRLAAEHGENGTAFPVRTGDP